jgi:hypothetical protein
LGTHNNVQIKVHIALCNEHGFVPSLWHGYHLKEQRCILQFTSLKRVAAEQHSGRGSLNKTR